MSISNLRPFSSGNLRITGKSVNDPLVIDPKYLQHPEDQKIAVDSLRLVRHVLCQPAMSSYSPQEELPGRQYMSYEQLVKTAGSIGFSTFNAAGTCKMGPDNSSVVSADLKVHGISGLRVADASVIPTMPFGSSTTSAAVIALKAAKLIAAEANLDMRPRLFHPYDLYREAWPHF